MTALAALSDGEALGVARQANWLFGVHWMLLRTVDPGLPEAGLSEELDKLVALGAPDVLDPPSDWTANGEATEAMANLRGLTSRALEAGRTAFDRPDLLHLRTVCTADNPMTYYVLAHALAEPARVELLALSDDDWAGRAAISGLTRLRGLALGDVAAAPAPLGIELSALPNLEFLDLGGRDLKALPDGIAGCARLRWLGLSGNPIRDIGALEKCGRLAYVSARRTGLGDAHVEGLRARGVVVAI